MKGMMATLASSCERQRGQLLRRSLQLELKATHIRRPILDLRGEFARLQIQDGQIVQVTDEDELEAIDSSAKLEQRADQLELSRPG